MPLKLSYRILYIILAFVCFLMFVMQPISVAASGVGVVVAGVAGVAASPWVVVGAILVCLGLYAIQDGAFDTLVDVISDAIPDSFKHGSDIKLVQKAAGNGTYSYYAPVSLVSWVHDFLWGRLDGIDPTLTIESMSFSNFPYNVMISDLAASYSDLYDLASSYTHCTAAKLKDGTVSFLFSDASPTISTSGSGSIQCNSISLLVNCAVDGGILSASILKNVLLTGILDFDISTALSSTLDIGFAEVGSTLESGVYDEWINSAQPFEWSDEEAALYVPFVLDENFDLTQDEAQDDAAVDLVYPTVAEVNQSVVDNEFIDDVTSGISGILGTLKNIWNSMINFFNTCISEITDLGIVIGDFFASFFENLGNWFLELFSSIGSAANTIVSGITLALQDIFVPSEDFLSAKIDSLRSEFGFVNDIIIAVDQIRDVFNESADTPPVIYADLSAAESIYDWGDRAVVLDLTWYERYKPTADTLISAFLWVVFIWRCFVKLPGIISGDAGDLFMDTMYDTGKVEPRSVRRARLYRDKHKKKESGSDV